MHIRGLDEMEVEAARFAGELARADVATVVALSGDLGAGKTTFSKFIAKQFGVIEVVTSPTFVLEKIYSAPRGPFRRIVHIDAYRMKGAHELEMLGWRELTSDPDNLILIEWPENVDGAIPESAKRISLSFVDEDSREIHYGA